MSWVKGQWLKNLQNLFYQVLSEKQKMHDEPKNEEHEEVKAFVEEANWDRPDYIFLPKGNHLYHQEGYYLICQSCDLTHAVFIGSKKIMVGEKDGQPILKTRKEVGMA
jgi:hypothetical protein